MSLLEDINSGSISFNKTICLKGSTIFSSSMLMIMVLSRVRYEPERVLTLSRSNWLFISSHTSFKSFKCFVIIDRTASSSISERLGITELKSISLLSDFSPSFLNSLYHSSLQESDSSSRYSFETKLADSSYFFTMDSIPSFW